MLILFGEQDRRVDQRQMRIGLRKIAQLLFRPGERVLDLCAAPGGKATELNARLQGLPVSHW